MTWMEWSEALATGVEPIDDEHRQLVALLNRIDAAVAGGQLRTAARLLGQFVRRLDLHTQAEDAVLARLGFEGLARRRSDHQRSRAILADHPLDADDVELVREAAEYAKAWCLDHIVRHDLPLRALYAEKGMARRPRRPLWERIDFIRLRWRIALLAVVPLAALAVVSTLAVAELERTAEEMGLLREMNALNAEIGGLVHELQRERALAAMYVSNPNLGSGRLDDQLKATDAALARYAQAMQVVAGKLSPGPAMDAIENAESALDLVHEIREDIARGSHDSVETIDFYTVAISDLVAVVPEVVREAISSDFAKNTFAYVFLLEAKERAGRERALGAAGLAGDKRLHLAEDVHQLAAEQSALEQGFLSVATPDLADSYRRALGDINGSAMPGLRRALQEGSMLLTGPGWFDAASQRIDAMRMVEAKVSQRLADDVAALEQRALQRSLMLGGGLAVLFLASMAGVVVLGWTILPPLRRLRLAMRRLAEGQRAVEVPFVQSKDELGDIARTVQVLRESLVHADMLGARRWTENAERMRAVTDNLPGVVFRVRQPAAGTPVVACVSRKLREFGGLAPAAASGAPLRSVLRRLVRVEDRPALLHALHHAGRSPRPLDLEFRLREARQGRPRWLRVVASPIRTDDGWAWDGVALDVTGLHQAEEERTRAAAHLNGLYRVEATARFVGSIGHEFNGLLQPIIGFGELAAHHLPDDSPAAAHLRDMLMAAQRAKALVERVLSLGGQGEDDRKPVEAVAVVAEGLALARPTIPAHVVLRTRLDGAGALVLASPGELQQVVTQLCSNAVHAMGKAGGTLTVATEAVSHRTDGQERPHFRLSVADTGCGMDRPMLESIFTPFFTTKPPGQGTGLGLSVVRSVVEDCGGWMEVASEPGLGTTFDVFLPLHDPRPDNVVSFEEAMRCRTATR